MSERYSILILDDDQNHGELLKMYLESSMECQVDYIDDPAGFWEQIGSHRYDLLFLDYMLGEVTGLEILAELRLKSNDLPVIMMTGEGSEKIAVEAMKAGASDYLVKGNFNLASLPALVRKTVEAYQLKQSYACSLEQIQYQALLLNNIREAVVVWDTEGRITFWNPAAYLLYGKTPAEQMGRPAEEAYFPLFTPSIHLPGPDNTSGLEIERRFTGPRGETVWVSARTSLLRETSGKRRILGYLDVARNITRQKQEQQALKESQHFIQRILDTSPNILYIYDLLEDRNIYINRDIGGYLGYRDFPTHASWNSVVTTLVHPEDLPKLQTAIQSASSARDGEITEVEYRVRAANQQWQWFLSRHSVFARTDEGQVKQTIGVMQDITARKEAEQALRRRMENEQLIAVLSSSFITIQDGKLGDLITGGIGMTGQFIGADCGQVIILDAQKSGSSRVYTWAGGSRPTGEPLRLREVLLASPWCMQKLTRFECIHTADVQQVPMGAEALRQALLAAEVHSITLIPMQYNGCLIGALAYSKMDQPHHLQEEDLQMLRAVGEILVNTLMHHWKEEELARSETLYRAIVDDHQTELICRFSADTRLTFVNEAYCRYFGKAKDELLGTQFLEMTPAEERAEVQAYYQRLNQVTPVSTYERRVLAPNGEIRWHEWTDRAIFDQKGKFVEYQSVGRDVTERKEMQAKIQNAQAKLAEQSRLAAVGQLASSIAHQINNPLTTIIGEAQLLLADHLEGQTREALMAVEEAGWRAQQVVQSLLEFSQPPVSTLQPVDINETIRNALVLCSASLGAPVETQLAPGLPTLQANASQIQDLWINLLLDARTAPCGDGPRHLFIRTGNGPENEIIAELWDSGRKIPAEALETIFEPGLQPANQPVSGMELSICREIVRQYQGSISVESGEQGTRFSIVIPGKV